MPNRYRAIRPSGVTTITPLACANCCVASSQLNWKPAAAVSADLGLVAGQEVPAPLGAGRL